MVPEPKQSGIRTRSAHHDLTSLAVGPMTCARAPPAHPRCPYPPAPRSQGTKIVQEGTGAHRCSLHEEGGRARVCRTVRREGTDVSRAVMSSSVGKGEFKCDSSWYRQGSEFKSGSEFKCDSDDQARVSSSVTRGFKFKVKGHRQWLKFPVVMSMG